MPTSTDSIISEGAAPVFPAPIPNYPQFYLTAIPEGSGAVRAYRGYIRPFSDDATACSVLRAFEANSAVTIASGRISADANGLSRNLFEDFLVDMAEPCTVVVLEFAGKEHPRCYLIDPPMVPRFSENLHVRKDRSLCVAGQLRPALCVYSGSLFKYSNDGNRLEQFLDQLATYLGKHLIWLRSRSLYRRSTKGPRVLVRLRLPGEKLAITEVKLCKKYFLHGYWAGQAAPMSPDQHLATIDPNDECWCWSGEPYGKCCLLKDQAYVARINKR
jgi:hypothetical protein